jgi:integrase
MQMQRTLNKAEIEEKMRTSNKFTVARNLRLEKGTQGWYWNIDFSFNGKRGTHRIGQYQNESLEAALQKVAAYQGLIAEGMDPALVRKNTKGRGCTNGSSKELRKYEVLHPKSFKSIADRWLENKKNHWGLDHYEKTKGRINNHLISLLGHKLIDKITAKDVSEACQKLIKEKKITSARDIAGICTRIFNSAQNSGFVGHNPCVSVTEELPPAIQNNYAAQIKPKQLAKVLQKMYAYEGTKIVQYALKLLPLLLVRPGNLRFAEWSEIDLRHGLWLIPAVKMKASQEKKRNGTSHVVPLSRQAVVLMSELYKLTGKSKFLFPCMHKGKNNVMSENTINAALRRMGISTKNEQTAHGFRATGRTMLEEFLEEQRHKIELQLDHTINDNNGTSYNRGDLVKPRKEMMQKWSDYVDRLLAGDYGDYYDVEEEFTPVTECIEFVPETQQRNFNVKPKSAEKIIVLATKKSHWDEWMETIWASRPLSKSNNRPEACLH